MTRSLAGAPRLRIAARLGRNLAMHRLRRLPVTLAIYALLTVFAFTLAYPLLYLVSTSLKSVPEYLNPLLTWIPVHPDSANYVAAWAGLCYAPAFLDTLEVALLGALCQVAASATIGYGLGRPRTAFRGRNLVLGLVLLTLIVPPETVIVALYRTYVGFHWINTPWPLTVPGLFGQGLRGGLFILVFRQVYAALPGEVEEAGQLDGAGPWRIWWSLMLPLAGPALTVTAVLSFVWHWNDYFQPAMFLNANFTTLPLRFANAVSSILANPAAASFARYNVSVIMAEAVLVTAPALLGYVVVSRFFLRSFDRAGGGEF
jgi:multiple sugar transport system permease protein